MAIRPRERITVTIRDTGLGAALHDIGRTYGFEIKGTLADGNEAVSTTLSGDLESVLTRLLRNVNHVIVRSPDNRSGIEKVIIIGRQLGAAAERLAGHRGRRPVTSRAARLLRDR